MLGVDPDAIVEVTIMEEWLLIITRYAIVIIKAMAFVIIAFGTIEAFLKALRVMFSLSVQGPQFRHVWMRYARWLVAGLTFQLAADIIETSIAPGWEDVGRLAAIAVIRTFLNFLLERDLAEVHERQ
jgi:uncharacterized membrane protein